MCHKGGEYTEVFHNRVLRSVSESHGEKAVGGWGNLCNEELHGFCCSLNIIIIKIQNKGGLYDCTY
jgi:hypothetical protein